MYVPFIHWKYRIFFFIADCVVLFYSGVCPWSVYIEEILHSWTTKIATQDGQGSFWLTACRCWIISIYELHRTWSTAWSGSISRLFLNLSLVRGCSLCFLFCCLGLSLGSRSSRIRPTYVSRGGACRVPDGKLRPLFHITIYKNKKKVSPWWRFFLPSLLFSPRLLPSFLPVPVCRFNKSKTQRNVGESESERELAQTNRNTQMMAPRNQRPIGRRWTGTGGNQNDQNERCMKDEETWRFYVRSYTAVNLVYERWLSVSRVRVLFLLSSRFNSLRCPPGCWATLHGHAKPRGQERCHGWFGRIHACHPFLHCRRRHRRYKRMVRCWWYPSFGSSLRCSLGYLDFVASTIRWLRRGRRLLRWNRLHRKWKEINVMVDMHDPTSVLHPTKKKLGTIHHLKKEFTSAFSSFFLYNLGKIGSGWWGLV